jgi:FixJ family two-component response regulator
VRSTPGKGTVFTLVIALGDRAAALRASPTHRGTEEPPEPVILLVEDDQKQRDALRALLELEGYRVMAAANGNDALRQVRDSESARPNVIVADYNLPGGMTGPQTIRAVCGELGQQVPALVVSGDKSAATLGAIEASGFLLVTKPVRTADLMSSVDTLARTARPGWQRVKHARMPTTPVGESPHEASIAIIEDDLSVRDAFRVALESDGYKVATFGSGEAFFADAERRRFRCLVVDLSLPGLDGIALQDRLRQERATVPVIFVTGSGSLSLAVKAMREGAADFLQKPVRIEELRESVGRVLATGEPISGDRVQQDDVTARLATLTERERQVLERVVAGESTRHIAAELGISERTIEQHRHNLMRKIGAKSLAMLVRMVALHVARQ